MKKFLSCAVAAAVLTSALSASIAAIAEETILENNLPASMAQENTDTEKSETEDDSSEIALSEDSLETNENASNTSEEESSDTQAGPTLDELIEEGLKNLESASLRKTKIAEYQASAQAVLEDYSLPAYGEEYSFVKNNKGLSTFLIDQDEFINFQNKVDNNEKDTSKIFDVDVSNGQYIMKLGSEAKNSKLLDSEMNELSNAISDQTSELGKLEEVFISLGMTAVYDEEIVIPFDFNAEDLHNYYWRSDKNDSVDLNDRLKSLSEKDITVDAEYSKLIYRLGSGNDIYHIVKSSTPVNAIITDDSGNDTIFFDYDTDPNGFEYIKYENELYINDYKNLVFVRIPNYFSSNNSIIENIAFRDGTILSYNDILIMLGTLLGSNDDDTLTCSYKNNFVYGLDGNDTITTTQYTDFIYGGKGDDIIQSNSGKDIIYYRLGDGNDTIDDTRTRMTPVYTGYDILYLADITPDMTKVIIPKDTYNIILFFPETNESVTLPGNRLTVGTQNSFPIEEIHFADDTIWTIDDLIQKALFIVGSDEDDELHSYQKGDTEIYGLNGNDKIYGGTESDSIYGGKGDDYIAPKTGNDIFYYNLGDGNDTIDVLDNRNNVYGGTKKLVFGEGILPDETEIILSPDGKSYTFKILSTGETVTVNGNKYTEINGIKTSSFPIKSVEFADGTVWDIPYYESHFIQYIYGTDDDDTIKSTKYSNIILCGKGNDIITDESGDETYIYEYGDGCDIITDSSNSTDGNDILKFGPNISADDLFYENISYNKKEYSRFYIKDNTSYVQLFGVDEVEFSDGTITAVEDLVSSVKPASEMNTVLAGDINSDGLVNVTDISILQGLFLGQQEQKYAENADVNKDGSVTILDLISLIDIILG